MPPAPPLSWDMCATTNQKTKVGNVTHYYDPLSPTPPPPPSFRSLLKPRLPFQPDDLLGMGVFDSSPSTGVPPPPAASPVGVGTSRPIPRSPPMHAAPMAPQMGGGGVGVGGAGGGGFGVTSAGMGAHRQAVSMRGRQRD